MKQILETERVYLRQLTQADYEALSTLLQDEEVMYAYEHAFTPEEVQEWLDKQLKRYLEDGIGLWAIISKETGEFLGQAGLTCRKQTRNGNWKWAICSKKSIGIRAMRQKQLRPAKNMLSMFWGKIG